MGQLRLLDPGSAAGVVPLARMVFKMVLAIALLVPTASAQPENNVTTSAHVEVDAPLLRGSAASATTLQDVGKNGSLVGVGSINVTAMHDGCAAACGARGYAWSHCWDRRCRCSQRYWETPYTCASGTAACNARCGRAGYGFWHCVAGTGWVSRSCECTSGYHDIGLSCY